MPEHFDGLVSLKHARGAQLRLNSLTKQVLLTLGLGLQLALHSSQGLVVRHVFHLGFVLRAMPEMVAVPNEPQPELAAVHSRPTRKTKPKRPDAGKWLAAAQEDISVASELCWPQLLREVCMFTRWMCIQHSSMGNLRKTFTCASRRDSSWKGKKSKCATFTGPYTG